MIFKFLETREGKENTVIVARKKLESKVRFGVSSTSRAVLCEIKRQREEREKLMTMRGILILELLFLRRRFEAFSYVILIPHCIFGKRVRFPDVHFHPANNMASQSYTEG